MICASLNRAVFIKNLLRYLAEKILLLNTTNFRGDYLSNISSSLKLLELISGTDETSTEFSSISYDKRVETAKGYTL